MALFTTSDTSSRIAALSAASSTSARMSDCRHLRSSAALSALFLAAAASSTALVVVHRLAARATRPDAACWGLGWTSQAAVRLSAALPIAEERLWLLRAVDRCSAGPGACAPDGGPRAAEGSSIPGGIGGGREGIGDGGRRAPASRAACRLGGARAAADSARTTSELSSHGGSRASSKAGCCQCTRKRARTPPKPHLTFRGGRQGQVMTPGRGATMRDRAAAAPIWSTSSGCTCSQGSR